MFIKFREGSGWFMRKMVAIASALVYQRRVSHLHSLIFY